MKYEPHIKFTVTYLTEAASPEEREAWNARNEDLIIRCSDESRMGQLGIKLEEYIFRAQTSADKKTVRNAICKIAITDSLLGSEEHSADYVDAFAYAKSGLEAYGADLLIESFEEADEFLEEFDIAFDTIRSYVNSGNQFVTGGTQLPEAI